MKLSSFVLLSSQDAKLSSWMTVELSLVLVTAEMTLVVAVTELTAVVVVAVGGANCSCGGSNISHCCGGGSDTGRCCSGGDDIGYYYGGGGDRGCCYDGDESELEDSESSSPNSMSRLRHRT
jgi:hypothetical protein